MTQLPGQSDDQSQPQAPPRLVKDLRALYRAPGDVRPMVDQAILARASASLAGKRRLRMLLRWGGGAAAAAAAAAILVGIWLADGPASRDGAASPPQLAARIEAIRHGQRPNIVDAMLLARQIERAAPADRQWDINGDGVVDRKDVDTIAQSAVSLKGGNIQ